MAISTEKKNKVKLRLEKINLLMIRARVGLLLDLSGSTKSHYLNGTMTDVTSRFVPIAMRMDDNMELDIKGFSEGHIDLPAMTEDNYETYMKDNVINLESKWRNCWNGTVFSSGIQAFYDDWFAKSNSSGGNKWFLSKIFGKKEIPAENSEKPLPAILFIITDGDNDYSDRTRTLKLFDDLKNSEMYVVFFSIGRTDFSFIKAIADDYPNVGYFNVQDFSVMNDDEIYNGILTEEMATFLNRAIVN